MSRRKLRTPVVPTGDKAWCGPFSLMAVTGLSLEAARRHIRKANGWDDNHRIRGLYTNELAAGFRSAGVPIQQQRLLSKDREPIRWKRDYPTFTAWLNNRRGDEIRAMFLVVLTDHFVVVNGNEFIDTFTLKPVKLDDCPHRRSRVKRVFRIGG